MRHIKRDLYNGVIYREVSASREVIIETARHIEIPVVEFVYGFITQPVKRKSRENKYETL